MLYLVPAGQSVHAQGCSGATCGSPVAGGPGDVDGSGAFDPLDLVYLVNYCFKDGPAPVSLCNAEVNGLCNPYFACEPTIGDVVRMIEVLYLGTGTLLPCTSASNPPATSDIVIYPKLQLAPNPIGGGFLITQLFLQNNGPVARMIYGYSLPMEVTYSGGITSTDVSSLYSGPGGVWTTGQINRGSNRVYVYATPDGARTGVSLPPGQALPLMLIEVRYGPSTIGSYVDYNTYIDANHPAEIPLISTNGLLKGISIESASEELVRTSGSRLPATSRTGRTILMVLVVLIGMVFLSRHWRVKSA